MRKKFIETQWQEILDSNPQNITPQQKRMLVLLSQWKSYKYVATSEWLERKDIEQYFNELVTKFYHKTHKFPKPIIHIYKDGDRLDWTEGMKPDDTTKSIRLTNIVLSKLKSGTQEDLLSLI